MTLLLFASFDHGNSPFFQQPWFELFHPERARPLQLLLGLGLMLQLKIFGLGHDLPMQRQQQQTNVCGKMQQEQQQQSGIGVSMVFELQALSCIIARINLNSDTWRYELRYNKTRPPPCSTRSAQQTQHSQWLDL
eukprot:jgi/Psemu1/7600/gm1.7600_g